MLTVVEKTKNHSLRIRDCGLADYRQALREQHQLCKKRQEGKIPNTVLIAEHPPVITLGARQSANKLLASRSSYFAEQEDTLQLHFSCVKW